MRGRRERRASPQEDQCAVEECVHLNGGVTAGKGQCGGVVNMHAGCRDVVWIVGAVVIEFR